MSEERFVAIENRLTSVEVKIDGLTAKVDDLGREMHTLHAESSREMHTLHDALSDQMRVLHENTIANIKDLAPDPDECTRKFTEADKKLREDINRRLDPLEAFARTRGFDPPTSP